MLGPRLDRFPKIHPSDSAPSQSKPASVAARAPRANPISGHSMPLVSLGGFILIMGFMAFNGGSQGSVSRPGDGDAIGRAILATMVACGSSGMVVLLINKFFVGGTWSLPAIINGCITGTWRKGGGVFTF